MDTWIKSLIGVGIETIKKLIIDQPYMIVHDSAFVCIDGKKGRIVWDYLLYNELTFETEDGEKYSMYSGHNDEETRAKFDCLKSKYGI